MFDQDSVGVEVSARRSDALSCRPAAIGGHRQSRSAVSGTLMVPWTRTSTGQRSFAVYGPRTWNRLPPALGLLELSLSSFKRQLKAHLFQHCVLVVHAVSRRPIYRHPALLRLL